MKGKTSLSLKTQAWNSLSLAKSSLSSKWEALMKKELWETLTNLLKSPPPKKRRAKPPPYILRFLDLQVHHQWKVARLNSAGRGGRIIYSRCISGGLHKKTPLKMSITGGSHSSTASVNTDRLCKQAASVNMPLTLSIFLHEPPV